MKNGKKDYVRIKIIHIYGRNIIVEKLNWVSQVVEYFEKLSNT